jgi:hypothetical protein
VKQPPSRSSPFSPDMECRYRLLINSKFRLPPSGKLLWNFCFFESKPQASTACRYFNYSRCVINNYNIYNLPFAGKLNYLHTVLHSPEHLALQIKFTESCRYSPLSLYRMHGRNPILLQNFYPHVSLHLCGF